MLLRESLGISADGSEKLYPQQDCEDFINRQGEVLKFHDRDHRRNVQHVFGNPTAEALPRPSPHPD